jgi:hypothetical protein
MRLSRSDLGDRASCLTLAASMLYGLMDRAAPVL